MDKPSSRIQLTELFMAKAGKRGWDRCFYGTIKREIDSDGNPIVIGKIKVLDGFICAQASTQWILGEKLDELVLMILDKGLHNDAGMKAKTFNTDFFLN